MRYHLCKASRLYTGHAYNGPSSDGMSCESDDLDEALAMRGELLKANPVGWDVL